MRISLAKLTRIRETLFGLPWTVSGGLLATLHSKCDLEWYRWGLLIGAFVAARLSGMCFNRLIDMAIDTKNPRTCRRALPSGQVTPRECGMQACGFLGLFYLCAYWLGGACFSLAIVAGSLLILYSFTKRFTVLCHFVLGLIQLFGPLCGWIAMTGSYALPPLLLGSALFCSIAAGDILYACQDIDFDRHEGLYSIPAKVGIARARSIAKCLHTCTLLLLLAVGYSLKLHLIFYVAVGAIGYAYWLAYAKKHEEAFRFSNIAAGLILFVATFAEIGGSWLGLW